MHFFEPEEVPAKNVIFSIRANSSRSCVQIFGILALAASVAGSGLFRMKQIF
jgi:hypothetical protein